MQFKEKGWIWRLLIIAQAPYTLVGHTLYFPKGCPPTPTMIRHEEIHLEQMAKVGMLYYYFLYMFVLPFLWNPWRRKWETEAYEKAQHLSLDAIEKKLSSKMYGWLRW